MKDKIIPEHVIELIRQSIDMVEGGIYPKNFIEFVPGRLRKVIKSLERINSEKIN